MFYLVPLLQVEFFLCLRYKVVLQTLALGSMACELYLCEIFLLPLHYQGSSKLIASNSGASVSPTCSFVTKYFDSFRFLTTFNSFYGY